MVHIIVCSKTGIISDIFLPFAKLISLCLRKYLHKIILSTSLDLAGVCGAVGRDCVGG